MGRKKSGDLTGQESSPSGAKSPVTLRLGDLEPEVELRAAGAPLGSIVRRDLARYYRLVRNYEVRFSTPDDADVVAHALRGFDDGAYQFLWAAVDEVLEGRDLLADEFGASSRFARVDREHLTLGLRMRLGDHGRRMAILDTIERYWQLLNARGIKPGSGDFPWPDGYDPEYPVTDPELDAMVEVGLIYEGTAHKYRKRRDDPNRPPLPPPPTEAELYLRDVQASAVAHQVLKEATERRSKRKPRSK